MNVRNLVSLEKCAATLNDVVPAARLREFADSGHLPHVRIDGEPFVRWDVVETWIGRNLVGEPCKGAQLDGRERTVTPAGPKYVPQALRPMRRRLRTVRLVEYPPGVYFLVQGDAVIYVGQSVAPLLRIASHQKEKDFEFAFYVPVPVERLDEVEGAFIRFLAPALNRGAPAERGRDQAVLEEFGLRAPLALLTDGTPPQAAP